MKKGLTFFILGVLLVSLSISFVSAASSPAEGAKSVINGAYEIVKPLLEVAIGETSNGENFLAKVLFLLIIFSVLWVALSRTGFFSDKTWVLVIVSVAASVLSIRWFGNAEVVRTAILPYSALGVTITCGLPFLLFFFVVKDFTKTMRQVAWIFFGVIFLGLWIMRSGSDSTVIGGGVGNFAYIYLITAILALIALAFDGTIQRYLLNAKIDRISTFQANRLIADLMDELDKIDARYKKDGAAYVGIYSPKAGHAGWAEDRKDIQKRMKNLRAGK